VTSDFPADAILAAAAKRKCDLIFMASHSRKGLRGMLLGSETQKVLARSAVPVLVFRGKS
jgi:nucleotide-binding universal stress UspA family protein